MTIRAWQVGLLALCFSVALNAASAPHAAAPASTTDADVDLFTSIAACPLHTVDTPPAELDDYQRHVLASFQGSIGIHDRELTAREKVATGFWINPQGMPVSLVALSGIFGSYYQKHGVLPTKLSDIAPELANAASVAKHSPLDILSRYPGLINPISGHLRQSFAVKDWAPGEVYAEMLTDPAEIAQLGERGYRTVLVDEDGVPGNRGVRSIRVPFKRALHIVMYGETPGSILFDDCFHSQDD